MTQIIDTQLVDLDLNVATKAAAIAALGQRLADANRLNDYQGYIQNVNDRETLTTTGIGFGIAIPHGKTNAVKTVSVAFGKLAQPIDWDSLDGEPVNMIFQLAVPESSKGDEHLRLISALSRKLIHDDFRAQLAQATSAQTVIDLIGNSLNSTLEV
ncbi:PTS sugar transporter subunit IIA [Lactiplantibacillus mudanjiangensis]|uniref:PTS mannose transporter subunit IIAB [Lactobacillus curvatus] n=1 Tax=Lactiplantibacillus mudanjiangensis TaxID=1296538 RepID=A0A660DV13_9LACO|nr:fructose PTS transporter subunit IIA [Lactiplantibacillus mudanjiangensis]VDG23800.1 PTS mannose transporter subunit IIAB [Lactobacillus curvatus] [Lactiplantibacillus mudanjiangensis]VDG27426.1 PTS mannose transporter subunit IIAB [Lactobacillus curvatus] [Lactiplantibacillus mudanjiangensis]